MALSASTVLEVRAATGSDTNGSGFVAGSSGTDWSQQTSPQYSVTDGVTAGTTTITSITASFGTDVVGNLISVSGGTGSVAQVWKQIISRTNSTTIVVDSSTGLTAGTGVTLKIGGALASLTQAAAIAVGGNKVFATGSFTQTATATFASAGGVRSRIIGYSSSRGDGGRASITLSTNTGLTAITGSNGWQVENIDINCASLGTSVGVNLGNSASTTGLYVRNCKIANFTTAAVLNTATITGCEITGGTSAATSAISTNAGMQVEYCNIHDNVCPGIVSSSNTTISVDRCRIVNNTGASSDGVRVAGQSHAIRSNVIHGNGRHGIFIATANAAPGLIKNNIITSNGGFGLAATATASPALPQYDGNAYRANTSGSRSNVDNATGIDATGTYTNVLDVTLTADPYTNASGGDFTLNNNSGGGAACRASGFPGTITGATGTGYVDMGLYQHQDAGGGGVTGGSYSFLG